MLTTAFGAGYSHGTGWFDAHGASSYANLSRAYVRDTAERFAAGALFRELPDDGPLPGERAVADEYVRAFHLGFAHRVAAAATGKPSDEPPREGLQDAPPAGGR